MSPTPTITSVASLVVFMAAVMGSSNLLDQRFDPAFPLFTDAAPCNVSTGEVCVDLVSTKYVLGIAYRGLVVRNSSGIVEIRSWYPVHAKLLFWVSAITPCPGTFRPDAITFRALQKADAVVVEASTVTTPEAYQNAISTMRSMFYSVFMFGSNSATHVANCNQFSRTLFKSLALSSRTGSSM